MAPSSSQNCTLSWKPASLLDTPVLLELMESYYAHDGLPFDRRKAEAALSQLINDVHLGEILLILYSDNIVGYVALTNGFSLEYGGIYQYIDELFIIQEFRGKALGTQTLQHVIERARQNEIASLHLEVEIENVIAQNLYKAQGFEDCGRHLWSKDLL